METIKAQCKKCKYEWKTNSQMVKVSCPSCGDKVILREVKKDE